MTIKKNKRFIFCMSNLNYNESTETTYSVDQFRQVQFENLKKQNKFVVSCGWLSIAFILKHRKETEILEMPSKQDKTNARCDQIENF